MNQRDQLIDFEGWKNEAYPDPLTLGEPFTIGVGHCGPEVHRGLMWADDLISKTLDADIAKADALCRRSFPWFAALSEPRQAVVRGMCFQMGIGNPTRGLLSFAQTLSLIRDERYEDAAEHMRQSRWGKQTPNRVRRLAAQLATGEWN